MINGICKELKILGDRGIVAIEIDGQAYAPVQDVQGTIRLLVDWKTGEVVRRNDCDSFGGGLTGEIPYAYAGKRIDAKTGLIYFGQRYYDPSLGRWLSRDPLWEVDHSNLYQYVFNNPLRYQDPYGESIGGYLLGIGQMVVGAALIATGAAIEVWTLGGYTVGFGIQAEAGLALITSGYLTTVYNAEDMQFDQSAPLSNSLGGLGGISELAYYQYMVKKETRTEPQDLTEKLTLEEAKTKPANSKDEIMEGKIKDPKYSKEEWKKVSHTHEKPDGKFVEVHYWENRWTGEKREFKFKND